MNAFGVLILVQPAVFCLVLGSSMCVTGITWILFRRYFPDMRHTRLWLAITLVAFFIVFSLLTLVQYDLPPMHFELIRGLE